MKSDPSEAIVELVQKFDFEAVSEKMKKLRWRWTVRHNPRTSAVPTSELIKVTAESLLASVSRQPCGTVIRQGGLRVENDIKGKLHLEFEEKYPRHA